MAHKKHQSPQSCNPQVRPHAESVDRPVDWSASRILRVPIRDWRPAKVGLASGPNSHDSQIPIGIAVSGSRDW